MKKLGFYLLLMASLVGSAVAQANDVVLKAMQDEMARSLKELKLPDLDRPYFISYRVIDTRSMTIQASLGALTQSLTGNSRAVGVEVKTGDYKLDDSNFTSARSMSAGRFGGGGGYRTASIDDDYDQIRRALWKTTDEQYKAAAEKLASKRSVLKERQGTDLLPDFIKMPAAKMIEGREISDFDKSKLEELAREASKVFRSNPEVLSSEVSVMVQQQYSRYLDSEGTLIMRNDPLVTFTVQASSQAKDGVPESDTVMEFARSASELDSAKLIEKVKQMNANLAALGASKSVDRYNGPVLFEGAAAGQVVAQVFAPAIVAARFPTSDQPEFETQLKQFMTQMGGESLGDRLGARVLPEWIDVVDRPREKTFNGAKLMGTSEIDDEGVATKDVSVVEHGILKAMLSTRTPSTEAATSTGSAHGMGAAPTNFFLMARKTTPEADMRKELLRLAKDRGFDYGIVVKDIGLAGMSWVRRVNAMADQNGFSAATNMEVFKVFADGHEERVRDIEFAPVTAASLKEILNAGDKPTVHNSPFIPMMSSLLAMVGGGGNAGRASEHIASFVVPSLLIDDLSVKHANAVAPHGPAAPSPLAVGAK